MHLSRKITPCLWFDGRAEEAAAFYTSVFEGSKVDGRVDYGEEGHDVHGGEKGMAMVVPFQIDGQPFVALNGGPAFRFNEAISFQVYCDTQEEVDYFWERLSEGGDPAAQQCGWLKDRFGVSWQVVPTRLTEMLADPDPTRSGRAMQSMLQMKKFDLAELERVYAGQEG